MTFGKLSCVNRTFNKLHYLNLLPNIKNTISSHYHCFFILKLHIKKHRMCLILHTRRILFGMYGYSSFVSTIHGWDSKNWFNPAILLCLSQDMTSISNVTYLCRGLFETNNWGNLYSRNTVKHQSINHVFNNLRREVIIRFVDISRFVDHHCLNFFFKAKKYIHTECGQKRFRFRHLPYIFNIKPFIFITFSWSHSLSDFHEIFSIKCRNKYSFFFV